MAWSEKEKQHREMGRPSKYTKAIADELCAYLSMGESLRTACEHEGMPSVKTVFNWFRVHEDFLQQYTRAKEEAADWMAEDILDISDNAPTKTNNDIQKAKLRVDTRKFLMAKMKPKRYGDKLDLTSDGKPLPTPIYGGKSSGTAKKK